MPILTKPTKLELEGDYSTWTLKWDINTDDGTWRIRELGAVMINENIDRVILIDDRECVMSIRKLSDGSFVSSHNELSWGFMRDGTSQSVLGKYLATMNGVNLEIYKNAVLIQTIPNVIKSGEIVLGIVMSPNGKYIFVCNYSTYHVLCYEGS
jgi:hypothetical protein